ncbi:unnamed protein product, partial [Nesidiocoris tenuis]
MGKSETTVRQHNSRRRFPSKYYYLPQREPAEAVRLKLKVGSSHGVLKRSRSVFGFIPHNGVPKFCYRSSNGSLPLPLGRLRRTDRRELTEFSSFSRPNRSSSADSALQHPAEAQQTSSLPSSSSPPPSRLSFASGIDLNPSKRRIQRRKEGRGKAAKYQVFNTTKLE